MCVSHRHQCSSSLDFDLNHPWKPGQITTPGASVLTRMKCSVNGNALTVGLVEAWAWSTLSKENDDFLLSSTPGEGNRLLLGSMAVQHRSQEASLLPRGYSLEWLRDPNTAAVF